MNRPHYAAPLFVVPFGAVRDRIGNGAGLQLSLNGALSMVTEAASVRQAILLLLSTRPGERLMRPDYGCDLRPLQFLPNDDTTAGLAIYAVRRALLKWEPRIDIKHLDARRDRYDEARLNIDLQYRVRGGTATEQIDYAIHLSGS
jgi:phage baseplate assembly protein W